jgi:hypothetical protein
LCHRTISTPVIPSDGLQRGWRARSWDRADRSRGPALSEAEETLCSALCGTGNPAYGFCLCEADIPVRSAAAAATQHSPGRQPRVLLQKRDRAPLGRHSRHIPNVGKDNSPQRARRAPRDSSPTHDSRSRVGPPTVKRAALQRPCGNSQNRVSPVRYFLNLRIKGARAVIPVPNSNRLAGSGTDAGLFIPCETAHLLPPEPFALMPVRPLACRSN